jgi:hypothetical protein
LSFLQEHDSIYNGGIGEGIGVVFFRQRKIQEEEQMKREVGLWIDHNKTVIVVMENEQEETREVHSNVVKYIRLSGGLSPKKPNLSTLSTSENMGDRRYENRLNGYYDGVVSLLQNADSICIFGPGEAKVELKKRLERGDLGGRIVSVEAADKMTNRQIAAKVREHYHISE